MADNAREWCNKLGLKNDADVPTLLDTGDWSSVHNFAA